MCFNHWCQFLSIYIQDRVSSSYDPMFNFPRNHKNVFHSRCIIFLLVAVHQFLFLYILTNMLFSFSPLLFLIIDILLNEVLILHAFDFHFHNDEWSWASFHIFFDHLYIPWRNLFKFFSIFQLGFVGVELYELFILDESESVSCLVMSDSL